MKNRQLSDLASNITPSPTLAVDAKAKALQAAGEDICGFGAGEPDFDTPEFIKEACAQALKDGKTKYCPAPGILELRKALAKKYQIDNSIKEVDFSQVVVSPGGKYSCYLAIEATCNPGDEVVVLAPYWVSYPEMVKMVGAVPKVIFAGEESGFKVSADQIKEAITDKTKLLILNSPSNPTGAVYTRKELEEIVQVALDAGIYIMSDEIYEYLLYDGVEHHSPASFSSEAARATITVGGFSKTFSMTGWRLGTLVANPELAKAITSIQSHTTSNATTFAQYGALAALENKEQANEALKKMRQAFDKRRLKLYERLTAIEGVSCYKSEGAFYLFPKISQLGLSSTDFATRLLDNEKVAVVPGVAFGADEYIRLSYATSDRVIDEGVRRLAKFCKSVKK